MLVIGAASELRVRFRASKAVLSRPPHLTQFRVVFYWPFQGGFSVTALLYLCVVISYVVFVLSSFVPPLSFVWCLGSAVLRDCGIKNNLPY